jgi:hypothetical protein
MRPFQPTVVRGFSLKKSIIDIHPKEAMDIQVGSHDDLEVGELLNLGPEESSVLDGLLGVVNGTGTNDDQETVVIASDDSCRSIAAFGDGFLRSRGQLHLVTKEARLDEGIVLEGG